MTDYGARKLTILFFDVERIYGILMLLLNADQTSINRTPLFQFFHIDP